jgi:hypothetical protein
MWLSDCWYNSSFVTICSALRVSALGDRLILTLVTRLFTQQPMIPTTKQIANVIKT